MASLLKTDQAKLAVLSHADAKSMTEASGPLGEYAPMPLQVLLANRTHVLAARDNLPLHHAYAITSALLEDNASTGLAVPLDGMHGMAVHPGARAAALGEKVEPPPAEPA